MFRPAFDRRARRTRDYDDGILDSHELGLAAGSTDPLVADTDKDGLPDGLERGLTVPEENGVWTNTKRDLACNGVPIGRLTWIPASVIGFALSPTLVDTDGDGLPDGIEDTNANGRDDHGELNPTPTDSDGDRLADGLELQIWGADSCTILRQRPGGIGQAIQYGQERHSRLFPRRHPEGPLHVHRPDVAG